jgi:DNA helicase-2/ATP-dependent DNA helicase PcrA
MSTGTREEIDEERRLLYVAMTRARDHLHLMLPQQFHVHQQAAFGDRHVYASRTRFITNSATRYFAGCAWPAAVTGSGGPAPVDQESKPRVDLSARVRALWR